MAENTIASYAAQGGAGTLQALQDVVQQRIEQRQKGQETPDPSSPSQASSVIASSLVDNGRTPRVDPTQQVTDSNSVRLSQEAIDRYIEERQARQSEAGQAAPAPSASSAEEARSNPLQQQINDLLGDNELGAAPSGEPTLGLSPGSAEPGSRTEGNAAFQAGVAQGLNSGSGAAQASTNQSAAESQQRREATDLGAVGNGVDILGNRPIDKMTP